MALEYQEILDYTQGKRKAIAEQLAGTSIPNDPETLKVLLSTLKDMDRTAIDDRKANIDAQKATNDSDILEAFTQYVHIQKNGNPFMRNPDGSVGATDTAAAPVPAVDVNKLGGDDIPDYVTETGVCSETSADFVKRMEPIMRAELDDEE